MGADISVRNAKGQTALDLAMSANSIDIALLLIVKGDPTDNNGVTALMRAADRETWRE